MIGAAVATVGSGGIVGFMLGLLGGGGSILATPLLLYAVGVSSPHIAIGTSALAVSTSALANFAGHALKGNVWWRCATVFATVGALGALAGSSVGIAMDGQRLLVLFGVLMIVVAGLMLKPRRAAAASTRRVDRRMCLLTAFVSLFVGGASGFFGIGGGFLIVPALLAATGMPMINAVGSSLLAVSAFGIATAVNYAASGLIDWLLAAEFIGGSILGGLVGMTLGARLSAGKDTLNRIFAGVIFIVAGYMLWRGVGPLH